MILKFTSLIFVVALRSTAQEVHVARSSNNVALGVWAQEPYTVGVPSVSTQKMPILVLECTQKGKKAEHHLNFSPGGPVVNYGPEVIARGQPPLFNMLINGVRTLTVWAAYNDTVTFTYAARSEKERVKFIQSLLGSETVSIEFMPVLGLPTASVFDLSKLRIEMSKYPECAVR